MSRQATKTAVGPMALVAGEQYRPEHERLVRDELAYRLLPTGVRWVVAATRWRPLRDLLLSATEGKGRGLTASLLCRKRYVDDKLQEALDARIATVVILGAGLDTVAYRHPALADLRVFEVDLPENIDYKRTKLIEVFGTVPDHVVLVPMDLDKENLQQVLAAHGYRAEWKTFFVWEAVTQYLTSEGVRKTLASLAAAAGGSRLVFTYIREDFLDGVVLYGAEPAYREFRVARKLWRFGLDPDRVADFLAKYGWREAEQCGSVEFRARYVKPTGRDLPVSEIERSVYAEKI